MQLAHLASRLYGTPLLLARAKLDIILNVLGDRIGWPHSIADSVSDSQNSPQIAQFARSDPTSLLNLSPDLTHCASGIAVIGINGSLVRRNIGIEAQSGLMSYAEIAQNLELTATDPSISGILLDIDSPGGEAGGVFELAQRIREVDAIKPVWALACDSAFSAAYAIACAASRVLVTQTSGLGSIGVIAMHVDQSVRDAQQGYRFTAVTAGDFKGDLSPHEPLNAGSSTRLQAEVDRLYGLFVDHVASMRTISQKAVRATQAACFFGPESIDVGLADALVRSDRVVAEFADFLAKRPVHRLLNASASVLSVESPNAAAVQTPCPTPLVQPVSPILNATPKEPPMTQDLPSNKVPQTVSQTVPQADPVAQELPDPVALPATGTPISEGEPNSAQPRPKSDEPGAAADAHAQALEIAQLCQLAGQTSRIASFLAQGISATQVRQALLLSRAQSEEIASLIHPDAARPVAKATSDGASTLLAAVKKLTSTP
jgi:signal peptide peptidase SppA